MHAVLLGGKKRSGRAIGGLHPQRTHLGRVRVWVGVRVRVWVRVRVRVRAI